MSSAAEHPNLACLSLYYDGEGADEFLASIEEHVAACAECRAQLEKFAALSQTLRDAPPQAAPASVLAGIRSDIQNDASHGSSSSAASPPPSQTTPPRWWSGAAAAVVLIGIVLVAWRMGQPPVQVALKEAAPPASGQRSARPQPTEYEVGPEARHFDGDGDDVATLQKLHEDEHSAHDSMLKSTQEQLKDWQFGGPPVLNRKTTPPTEAAGGVMSEAPPPKQHFGKGGAGATAGVETERSESLRSRGADATGTTLSRPEAVHPKGQLPGAHGLALEPTEPQQDNETSRRALPAVVRFYRTLDTAPASDVDLYVSLPAGLDPLALERALAEALTTSAAGTARPQRAPNSDQPVPEQSVSDTDQPMSDTDQAGSPQERRDIPGDRRTDDSGDAYEELSLLAARPDNAGSYRTIEISIDRRDLPRILAIAANAPTVHSTAKAPSPLQKKLASDPARPQSGKSQGGQSKRGKRAGSRGAMEADQSEEESTGDLVKETDAESDYAEPSPLGKLPKTGRVRVRLLVPAQ